MSWMTKCLLVLVCLAAAIGPACGAGRSKEQTDKLFNTCLENIERDGNLMRMKMKVLFPQRRDAPTKPYINRLEEELKKAKAGTAREMYLTSAVAFGLVAERDSNASTNKGVYRGVKLHVAMLEKPPDDWPDGTQTLRDEVLRDYLRFISIPRYRPYFMQHRGLFLKLFQDYLSTDNKSETIFHFGYAARTDRFTDRPHDLIRRQRMKMKGHFLPLKKSGIFCGEVAEWGDCERLLRWAAKAAPNPKERVAVLDTLSDFMEKAGKPDAALRYYRQAHENDRDVDTRLHIAMLLLKSGKKGEATKLLAAALGKEPDNTALYKAGRCCVLAGQYPRAVGYLEKYALAFDGEAARYNESLAAAYNLAIAYRRTGQTEKLRTLLQRVVTARRTGEGIDNFLHNVCASMLRNVAPEQPNKK